MSHATPITETGRTDAATWTRGGRKPGMGFIQTPPQLGNQYRDDRVLRGYLARTLPADMLREIDAKEPPPVVPTVATRRVSGIGVRAPQATALATRPETRDTSATRPTSIEFIAPGRSRL